MKLLRKLACLLVGHDPTVERRGDDSVLACGRFQLFDRVERHRRVVVFGGVVAVGVPELPGRVGVDQLERSFG